MLASRNFRAVMDQEFYETEDAYMEDWMEMEELPTELSTLGKIEEAVVSYGYEQATVEAWLQDKSASWKDVKES